MCGIAGVFNYHGETVDPAVLERMTKELIHRGPDDEGLWMNDYVGLGHRRLAIIDPTPAGHQPMKSADGRYVLSYNGEIYNFRELRDELRKKGYSFYSGSDTEVVLQ
ncbi:MAG: asparagine synthetase B, partial [Bacteroidales bacterium]|nr:asparagine synthetase B [Bacteroidales bacterium]